MYKIISTFSKEVLDTAHNYKTAILLRKNIIKRLSGKNGFDVSNVIVIKEAPKA